MARVPAPKKRRVRSPHPGVVLIPPQDGHPTWRARCLDPEKSDAQTKRYVKVRLNPLELRSAEARKDWAVKRAKFIAKRTMELASGAPRSTGTSLSDALDKYFAGHPQLRPRTRVIYRSAADKLLTWAEADGAKSADDLTRPKLMGFRESLIAAPKRVAVQSTEDQKAKRGTYKSSGKPRSAAAINQDLRSIRTVLGYVRDLDLFPKLTHDDLRRALKRLPVTQERIEYLKAHECQALLEAALRHDAATFKGTREEYIGLKPVGTTLRFDPIAPFVAFVLITGCRVGEAVALDWKDVDLDALDHGGRKVGEIHMRGASTKTHKARTVGLEVSPALRTLLAAMKLKSGGKGSVFGMSREAVDAAAHRLKEDYGAPESFSWQMLRRTCGTFLVNSAGIFGSTSAHRSAQQLGHSVAVAEKHYVGLVRGIDRDARSLEAVLQIEKQMARIEAPTSKPKAAVRRIPKASAAQA